MKAPSTNILIVSLLILNLSKDKGQAFETVSYFGLLLLISYLILWIVFI